jgi:hypothetical protein
MTTTTVAAATMKVMQISKRYGTVPGRSHDVKFDNSPIEKPSEQSSAIL